MKTREELLAIHAAAQLQITRLTIQEIIQATRLEIEAAQAEAREAGITLDDLPMFCHRCQRNVAHCVCHMWDAEPMTEQAHNRFPQGRYHEGEFR